MKFRFLAFNSVQIWVDILTLVTIASTCTFFFKTPQPCSLLLLHAFQAHGKGKEK